MSNLETGARTLSVCFQTALDGYAATPTPQDDTGVALGHTLVADLMIESMGRGSLASIFIGA
jgi:hypothetical protein